MFARFTADDTTSPLRLGPFLQGRNGMCTIARQLQETAWLARYKPPANLKDETPFTEDLPPGREAVDLSL